VETIVTRWSITQAADLFQQFHKRSSDDTKNASVLAGTAWKSSGMSMAVLLTLNCSY